MCTNTLFVLEAYQMRHSQSAALGDAIAAKVAVEVGGETVFDFMPPVRFVRPNSCPLLRQAEQDPAIAELELALKAAFMEQRFAILKRAR